MSLHFFAVPALQSEAAEHELERFCQSTRVLSVERQWVADGQRSFWALCVTTAPGSGALPQGLTLRGARAERNERKDPIDYKQALNEADFGVFSALRQLRNTLAERDGVPVYAVVTNQQLAQISTKRCTTLAQLGDIEGIGRARLEKYGDAFLLAVAQLASL